MTAARLRRRATSGNTRYRLSRPRGRSKARCRASGTLSPSHTRSSKAHRRHEGDRAPVGWAAVIHSSKTAGSGGVVLPSATWSGDRSVTNVSHRCHYRWSRDERWALLVSYRIPLSKPDVGVDERSMLLDAFDTGSLDAGGLLRSLARGSRRSPTVRSGPRAAVSRCARPPSRPTGRCWRAPSAARAPQRRRA